MKSLRFWNDYHALLVIALACIGAAIVMDRYRFPVAFFGVGCFLRGLSLFRKENPGA